MNEIVTESSHAQCDLCRILKTVKMLEQRANTRRNHRKEGTTQLQHTRNKNKTRQQSTTTSNKIKQYRAKYNYLTKHTHAHEQQDQTQQPKNINKLADDHPNNAVTNKNTESHEHTTTGRHKKSRTRRETKKTETHNTEQNTTQDETDNKEHANTHQCRSKQTTKQPRKHTKSPIQNERKTRLSIVVTPPTEPSRIR